MNEKQLMDKLRRFYVSEELDRITGAASKLPEKVLGLVYDITKGNNGPAPGEYVKETKTIILYEDTFGPNVLFHEIGHCIYHEVPEIREITDHEYKKDCLMEFETVGEGLSEEKGAAEFCANAYQLYKTNTISTEEDPKRYQNMARKLKERGI